jgi:ferric iron reductase protein FhuF
MPAAVHAADPLAPVRETLLAMGRLPGEPQLTGLFPELTVDDRAGWVPASALTSGGAALDDLLATARVRWNSSAHTAAALAWKAYTYWLALPAVVGFAGSRRMPLLRPENVLVRFSNHQPFLVVGLTGVEVAVLPTDPLALESRATRRATRIRVVPDETALLTEFRRSIVDEHLAPLLEQIRNRFHLGQHTLWGSLASGIAYGLSRSADVTPGSTLATANLMLDAVGLRDLVELAGRPDGRLDIQRRTCCLAFTLPEPKICSSCCIR